MVGYTQTMTSPLPHLSLRAKLALAFFAANLTLLGLVYLVTQYRFNNDFSELVLQQDLRALDQHTQPLIELYAKRSAWPPPRSIELREAVREMVMSYRASETRSLRLRRLSLLDQDGKHLIGPLAQADRSVTHELIMNQQTIGFLALPPLPSIPSGIEHAFVQQQNQTFLMAILATGLIAFGFALWFSARFVAPIRLIGRALTQLTAGERNLQLNLPEGDELSKLAAQVHTLARTLQLHEQAQDRWIADIAHELRTPLTVLRGETEALLDGVRPLSNGSIESLHQEVKHLDYLVSDLYDLSAAESGAILLAKKDCALDQHLARAASRHQQGLANRGLSMETAALSPRATMLFADSDRLDQILDNLISNSIRYCSQGATLRWASQTDGRHVVWSLEDSGPGFEGDPEQLFERLYRADRSRNRVLGGAGLGLAIVKSLTQAHTAEVNNSHSSMGGLKFTFRWPQGDRSSS